MQAYEAPGLLQPNYTVAIANRGYDTTTHSIPIHLNETVDIVFLNLASFGGTLEAHPWHSQFCSFPLPETTYNCDPDQYMASTHTLWHKGQVISQMMPMMLPGKG